MKIHNVTQSTQEWLDLRAGKPTTSRFGEIITPKTAELSKQAVKYRNFLLAEHILGRPLETAKTMTMARGNTYEQEAADAYELLTGRECEVVGFITTDDGLVGCSPDRLVGEDRLLEIKVSTPAIHVGYMLGGRLDEEHKPQVQGQLYITGRRACDVISYCPELKHLPVIIEAPRDEAYIEKLTKALWAFVAELMEYRTDLERRFGPFVRVPAKSLDDNPYGISAEEADQMVEQIWANRENV